MIRKDNASQENILIIRVSGTLVKEDYDQFNHWVNDILTVKNKVRLLCFLADFHGWGEASAIWEDAKFGVKHRKDIERFAMVGDKKWEEWMAKIATYFIPGETRYFDQSEESQALDWIAEG